MVCFGIPYVNMLCQVGDVSEQNGLFKLELYREKEQMMRWKIEHLLPRKLDATDIIPFIYKLFHKSYRDKELSLKAVADQ